MPLVQFPAVVELSDLNGFSGFKIDGEAGGDQSGWSVNTAGDVNGDGIDDFIIGASNASPQSRSFAGCSYVIFGKPTYGNSVITLSSLDGNNGFKLEGTAIQDQNGWSVSAAGDVNGDGISDIVTSAITADPSGRQDAGRSYVVFGKQNGWTNTVALSSLNGTNGFKVDGEITDERSGYSVSSAGDVNGDGIDDLIIGTYQGVPIGYSYIVFGMRGNWNNTLALSSLNGTNGFKLYGEAAGDFNSIVSGAGDVNGDGIDDLIIGAFRADLPGRSNVGCSYVIFGKSTGWNSPFFLSNLNGNNGFKIEGEAAGDQSGTSEAPIIKSFIPSPLMSPALLTETPLLSPNTVPSILKPLVPFKLDNAIVLFQALRLPNIT